ncbi:MAG: thioredoxin domain-containing protein [Candidatus Nanopelagicales bacterium]
MAEIMTCPSCGKRVRVPAVATGRPRCPSCQGLVPWIAHADDSDFSQVADSSRLAVLLDLWAPWCGPCHKVSPLLERLATERAGALKLVKVNVDKAPRTQAVFRAQSIPTLVLLQGGKEVGRQVGAVPLPQLRAWLDATLAN